MVEIILVRHGETSHNKNKTLQGQLDIKLSKIGVCRLKQLLTIYCINHLI